MNINVLFFLLESRQITILAFPFTRLILFSVAHVCILLSIIAMKILSEIFINSCYLQELIRV